MSELRPRSALRSYQTELIEKTKEAKTYGLFLDMGLGKTATTLTVINDLIEDFAVSRVLIIAPLRVAETVWSDEVKEWEHLKWLEDEITACTGTLRNRINALSEEKLITTINIENVVWLCKHFNFDLPFDMIVIDESSKFKNPAAKRFRALKKWLDKHNDKVPYRVILSGTPAPQNFQDLWSQIYILDHGKRLGENITKYRNKFFNLYNYGKYSRYELKEGAMDKIKQLIGDLTVSIKTEDAIDLPDVIHIIRHIELSDKLLEQYNRLEKEMVLALSEDTQITAMSANIVTMKLLQFCSGAIYDENKEVHYIHDLKLDELEEIIEENSGKPIMVAYNYRHELERLKERFPQAEEADKKGEFVARWNKGEIPILLVHPQSVGHGLNLQYGGDIIVWFGFTWSLENYMQLNKRLHRSGQKSGAVRLIHLAVGRVEYKLLKALEEKGANQKLLLEGLKYDIQQIS